MTFTPKVETNFWGFLMTKISIETKIIAVEAYLTGTDSKLAVRNRYHIAGQLFSVLVAIYEEYGR
ncbi:hypothetical protein OKN36_13580 [Furfurilactobacillus sp. OKN36]